MSFDMKFEKAFTIRSRSGMVSDPTYFPDLFESDRQKDVDFWWKGRVPEYQRSDTRIISPEQLQQEANEARKAKRALQKAKTV